MSKILNEARDFLAHAASAFLILVVAQEAAGAFFTVQAAIFLAWSFGFIREFTEWQDGGKQPFTPFGLLDQLGWITGGVAFTIIPGVMK